MTEPPWTLARDTIHVHWLIREPQQGRAPLLALLASYLGVAPLEVPIVQAEPHAKPRLAPPFSDICFNWSHSARLAVVAVAKRLAVGIDVERFPAHRNTLAIAQRFFAPGEAAALSALPEPARCQRFAALWTIKEAVLKASGAGLAHGLSQVVVDEVAGPRPRLLGSVQGRPEDWHLLAIEPPWADFACTLAWSGADRRVLVHPLAPA